MKAVIPCLLIILISMPGCIRSSEGDESTEAQIKKDAVYFMGALRLARSHSEEMELLRELRRTFKNPPARRYLGTYLRDVKTGKTFPVQVWSANYTEVLTKMQTGPEKFAEPISIGILIYFIYRPGKARPVFVFSLPATTDRKRIVENLRILSGTES